MLTDSGDKPSLSTCSLRQLLTYFVRLGAFGFGGPIALTGAMQRDLVDRRRWISLQEYKEGLALSQLAPGPLAAQLAIYLGWTRFGVMGATLVAFAFVLPSFLMVLGLAALYVRYGGLAWMQGVFYGVGAAVIAIIARSAWKLAMGTLGSKRLPWLLFLVIAGVTVWTESEIAWLFIGAGVVAVAVRMADHRKGLPTASILGMAPWFFTGLNGPAPDGLLVRIFLYFAEAGAFVFGSGLAIVPFLHGGVVNQFHWLNERQFLDAVAVAMITPGPVVITVAFIGYLVAGPIGRSERRVRCVPALLSVRDRPCSLLHADREESLDRRLRRRGYSSGHRSHRGSRDCPRTSRHHGPAHDSDRWSDISRSLEGSPHSRTAVDSGRGSARFATQATLRLIGHNGRQ